MFAPALLALSGLGLTSCGDSHQQPLQLVVIGSPSAPFESGVRLSPAAQLVRSATAEGLVALDDEGKVTPALADRWIITDDGQSYIFRLRDGVWPDGSPITAASVRLALRQAMAALGGTSLAMNLDAVEDVRAMAGRVVEIRLLRPLPDFLQLLAQPELGLFHKGKGAGPMAMKRDGALALFTAIPPEKRGLPADDSWSRMSRPVQVRGVSAAQAVADFAAGKADVVLGGGFADLPRLNRSVLGKTTARHDPVVGLFGLATSSTDGVLATSQTREAIAMAIDRDGLGKQLAVPGWQSATRILSPEAGGEGGERWGDLDMTARRRLAAMRISTWRAQSGKPAELRIALPQGPGADRLAGQLVSDLAAIGIRAVRVEENAAADLRLVDAVARFWQAAWFFDQLSCHVRPKACSPAADALAARASAAAAAEAPTLYAQGEKLLLQANFYIPLGQPVRWSLVGPDVAGFSVNRSASHPLLHMAVRSK